MYELTCDSHMSGIFAFVYGVHDLLRTAHETLSTPLGTNAHHKKTLCSTAPQQEKLHREMIIGRGDHDILYQADAQRESYESGSLLLLHLVFLISLFIPPSNYEPIYNAI